jgi:hypothetical protein
MRFNTPEKYRGRIGDRRCASWFAWKPVKINEQIRWLERVHVEQEVVPGFYDCVPLPRPELQRLGYCHFQQWKNVRFVD